MTLQRRGLPRIQDLPSTNFFLDDSNTSLIKYTAPFTRIQNDTCAGGTCTFLGNSSGSLEFTFNGKDVFLFGKPGGITRIFLDNQPIDPFPLDTSGFAKNGSALWAATGLNQSSHTVKLGGVDGDGLNLLIDFFSVNGVVSAATSTDTSGYLPPDKLTQIIIGSLIGFFALVSLIALSIYLYLRRKTRRRISKSGIKLVSVPGSAGNQGAGSSTPKSGFKSGFSRILSPRSRSSSEKEPQTAVEYGYRGRESNSTEAGRPFLNSSGYADTNASSLSPPYTPPVSQETSVPVFVQPIAQTQRLYQNSARPALSQQPLRMPVVPSAHNQHQRNLSSGWSPPDQGFKPERTPLIETPPVYSTAYPPAHQQDPSFVDVRHPGEKAVFKSANLPPRGEAEASREIWTASTVSTFIITQPTQTEAPQNHGEQPRTTTPGAIYDTPPPSFLTLEAHAGSIPPHAVKTGNNATSGSRPSPGKSLKGPRSRSGSNPQPTRPGAAEETQREGGGGAKRGERPVEGNPVGRTIVHGVTSSGVSNLRPEDEDPESPIDPAVNQRTHWY